MTALDALRLLVEPGNHVQLVGILAGEVFMGAFVLALVLILAWQIRRIIRLRAELRGAKRERIARNIQIPPPAPAVERERWERLLEAVELADAEVLSDLIEEPAYNPETAGSPVPAVMWEPLKGSISWRSRWFLRKLNKRARRQS